MKHVLLVDLLNSTFQLKHYKEKEPIWRFASDLRNIMSQNAISKVILCTDTGSSAYRLGLYPEYKEVRRARREAASSDEKAAMLEFFEVVNQFKELAPMFGFEVASVPNVEADDIVAYFSREIDTTKVRASILSSDTDLFQLLRPGVRQRSYGEKMKLLDTDVPTQTWVTYDRFCEVYEMTPYQYMQAKSIAGDTGDSIYSPEGVGEGAGMKLIRRYGSIDEVEKNIDDLDIPRFSKKGRENLKNDFWMVRRNVELISLLHDPAKYKSIFGAGLSSLEDIKANLEVPPEVDQDAIKEWLFENGRVGIYNKFDEWVKPFLGM